MKLTKDRLTKSVAAKAAAASIPPLDPVAFSLQVASPKNSDTILPSPQPHLVSPRRSKSFQATSASHFPPLYTPVPTSPVYTPNQPPSSYRSALRPEDAMQPLHIDSPFLAGKEQVRPTSLGGVSENSSNSSILSPLFDSFPSVPTTTSPSLPDSPLVSHGLGHGHDHQTTTRPTLPLTIPSFFDSAPLSLALVGAEFLPSPSPFPRSPGAARSATLPPRVSSEWQH